MKNKILFVCHGNICRSPMAEFVMKDLVRGHGVADQFEIDSKAATNDALGQSIDVRTVRELDKQGIEYTNHHASKIQKSDYKKYDYLICMDEENFMDMNSITGGDPDHKEYKLLSFAGSYKDIDDPWYTGDFDQAYQEISRGCEGLLDSILNKKNA